MADIAVSKRKEPLLSLILSFLVPGLGQIYNAQFKKGFILLAVYIISIVLILVTLSILIGFCFLILPVVIWVYGMYDAFVSAKKINKGTQSNDWLS